MKMDKVYVISAGLDQLSIEYAEMIADRRGIELVFVDSKEEVPKGALLLNIQKLETIHYKAHPIPKEPFYVPVKQTEHQPWRDKHKKKFHG